MGVPPPTPPPQQNTQSLRELFADLDALYGVHTRLYKLNHTIYDTTLRNLKAAKINSIRTTGTIIAALSAIIYVAIQVLPVNLSTVPILIIAGIIIFVFYLGIISYIDASKGLP